LDNPEACIARLSGSGEDITDVDTFLDNIFGDQATSSDTSPDVPESDSDATEKPDNPT
jgi:hypothetical protein